MFLIFAIYVNLIDFNQVKTKEFPCALVCYAFLRWAAVHWLKLLQRNTKPNHQWELKLLQSRSDKPH